MTVRDGADTHRVIKGRRWRISDPALDDELRQLLVDALMAARRAVQQAMRDTDEVAEVAARRRVNDAKVALGERGPHWWEPMTADDVALRLSCARRSLDSIADTTVDRGSLRTRLDL